MHCRDTQPMLVGTQTPNWLLLLLSGVKLSSSCSKYCELPPGLFRLLNKQAGCTLRLADISGHQGFEGVCACEFQVPTDER